MKNNNFYKFGVVILLACIAFTSCKKDNMPQTEPTTDNTAYSKMIINQINKFKTQMQNPERSGEMLLDTAVWNLEALINYENAYPDSASKNFTIMSSHYTVTIDENGMVSETEVQQVYNLMLDTLDYQLSLLNDEVKFAVFSDVQLDEVDGNTAQLTVNNGYGSGFILGLYPPFDDNWVWGTLDNPDEPPYAGNCSQTDFSSDGSNEIEYRLNHPAAMPANVGYTDIELVGMSGLDFEDDNGDPMLYVGTDINHCMSIEELNNNLINADYLIKHTSPEGIKPEGKSYFSVNIIDDVIVGNSIYLHYYYVTYGIPYFYQEH